tara:strand:+ start:213 stop:500 length:288 start_codon:yes stop_codon:yes gene_type:complete
VGSNELSQGLGDDHTRAKGDWSAHEVDDSGTPFEIWIGSDGRLKETDGDVHSSSDTPCGSRATLNWPWIALKVIQDGIESELTLANWYEESLEGS